MCWVLYKHRTKTTFAEDLKIPYSFLVTIAVNVELLELISFINIVHDLIIIAKVLSSSTGLLDFPL